jgi:hypothetical protein
MLLYIRAEDYIGGATPERKGPRPLHTIPETVSGLYDMGMRHHDRASVLRWATDGTFENVPDWKLDRLVIRIALFARERLGLEPGRRLAVFGRLGWLWPTVDFAAMGFAAVPVGIEHEAPDDLVARTLAEAAPAAAFATDAESAARLLAVRSAGRLAGPVVIAEGIPDEAERSMPLGRVLDLASTLDTAERAQAFRLVSRGVSADAPALWHVGGNETVRLTQHEAMERVIRRLRECAARAGDAAYIAAPRVTLAARLALAGFVGDGLTTTTLGREGRASEDLAELRPHKALVEPEWLSAACDGQQPRWPAGLDRSRARRRLRERLGDRLRWIETGGRVGEATRRSLAAAGVTLTEDAGGETGSQDRVH